MGKPFSARAARVEVYDSIGAQCTLLGARVTVSTNSDLIDVSNFESGENANGVFYGDWIGGITTAEITVEAYESDTENDANDIWGIDIFAGQNDAAIIVYPDANNVGRKWEFDPCTIVDIGNDIEVHGAVKIHLRARSRGAFTSPAGV